MEALLRGGAARFALLVGLILVFFLTYRHTIWLPRPGQHPEPLALLPVSDAAWHSAGWLLFTVLLLTLFATSAQPRPAQSDLPLRRLTLLALGIAYAVTAWARLATGRTFGFAEHIGPGALVAGALVALLLLAALLRRPPPTAWLLGIFLGAGVLLRLVLYRLIEPDPSFADNLPAIELSLERLVAGLTPYAIHEFGTHTNPMPYLPVTFLGYLPAYLLGLDIRLTNLVLTAALTLWFWRLLQALPLPSTTRNGLALLVGLLFVLPERLSKDVYTQWQVFNLLLVLSFSLIALGRLRAAAVAYGASLAAMPVALFVAPPLFLLAMRARPAAEVAVLAAIAAVVGGVPTLAFLLWNAEAFFTAFLFGTSGLWASLAASESVLPLLLWHRWLGGWLLAVQAAFVLIVAALSWTRLRTVRGLIALSATLYLALIITGPHIAQYMTTVVLYLALLAEAAAAAGVTAGDRQLARAAAVGARRAAQPA